MENEILKTAWAFCLETLMVGLTSVSAIVYLVVEPARIDDLMRLSRKRKQGRRDKSQAEVAGEAR